MPGKPIFDARLLEEALADAEIEYECQTENLPNTADPMKREVLDAVKRWSQYGWLAIENKHDVVPAEAGTQVRWIPACAGWRRLRLLKSAISRSETLGSIVRCTT